MSLFIQLAGDLSLFMCQFTKAPLDIQGHIWGNKIWAFSQSEWGKPRLPWLEMHWSISAMQGCPLQCCMKVWCVQILGQVKNYVCFTRETLYSLLALKNKFLGFFFSSTLLIFYVSLTKNSNSLLVKHKFSAHFTSLQTKTVFGNIFKIEFFFSKENDPFFYKRKKRFSNFTTLLQYLFFYSKI